jgi:hypothetical protein
VPASKQIPETQLIEFEKRLIYVIHDISMIDLDPRAAGIDLVIFAPANSSNSCDIVLALTECRTCLRQSYPVTTACYPI